MQLKGKKTEAAIVFAVLFVGLLFRRPDWFSRPQLWAEDGALFLTQYYPLGIKSLVTPYHGYLHTIPRLIVYLLGALNINLLYIPFLYKEQMDINPEGWHFTLPKAK